MLRKAAVLFVCLFLANPSRSDDGPPTGFQPEARVEGPTRLEWEFVAAAFGEAAAKLPHSFDSRAGRFQLYVPKNYTPDRSWPLIVSVSPGDAPLGWRSWRKVCEEGGWLFCAAYGAGNNSPPGQRVRVVLDVLDQVRRDYRIDPGQTYLVGFSSGARVACAIAFALPEYFGGVLAASGDADLPRLDYLRHRVRDRLSVALVTGERDQSRPANERRLAPLLRELGVRTRLWVVPNRGHAPPPPEVLVEVKQWLDEDRDRRRRDARDRPNLACPPEDSLTKVRLAARLTAAAGEELKHDERAWRGVAMLRGVARRWPRTEAGEAARQRLEELNRDQRLMRLVAEQSGREERTLRQARAETLESTGRPGAALKEWQALAKGYPFSPEGRRAAVEADRLGARLARMPYLGARFTGKTARVAAVAAGGPAHRAGLGADDTILSLGGVEVRSFDGLRQALAAWRPGDKVPVEVARAGRRLTLTVEVGHPPALNEDKEP